MNQRTLLLIATILLTRTPSHAMEVDSFYRRNQPLKDAADILNQEVNKRLQKAAESTNSCSLETLYTNVSNQLTAGSSGLGVISGMENWVESTDKIEKTQPPSREESVYYGTAFDSVWSVGFWLHLYQSALDEAKSGAAKVKKAIRWARGEATDPLLICKVPDEEKEFIKRFVESGGRPLPPGGPPPGGPKGPPGFGPKNGKFSDKEFAGGPPPDFKDGDRMKKMFYSEAMKCVQEEMGVSIKGTAALQVIINLNGSRVGADKVGHFFDNGADYFRKAYKISDNGIELRPDGKQKALEWGVKSEEGMFGLTTTGVKSYGDLAANYSGMKFWESLAGTQSSYFKCVDGKFQQQKKFDFRDYANDSWDEGINCSEFSSKEMTNRVNSNLANLGMKCPMDEKSCERLSGIYADVADAVLSPACKSSTMKSVITLTGTQK